MLKYTDQNAKMWDEWCKDQVRYTKAISHEKFLEMKATELAIRLTPGKIVPLEWFTGRGKRLLGLASGGGQQGPVLAAHGYEVTIMDYSEKQLESEKMVAERENYQIKTIRADMTEKFPFEDACFDIIFSPVSNCYIEELTNLWQECYRVLRKGGALMVGYTNPIMYVFSDEDVWESETAPLACKYSLPYNSRELEKQGVRLDPYYGYQFSHTLQTQIRGQLQAGFVIHDFYEDTDPRNRLSRYTDLYLADLAIKP
ncbi:MAG TPA: class I SAM-dependent methyltransferase [Bacillota bacterium]|nr:class I SAM-dependent methyltransferase [Bacillota bacterium]